MSTLLGISLCLGFGVQGRPLSLDGAMWAAAVVCAALAVRRGSRQPLVALSATGTAVLLGSLALVTP